MRKIVKQLLSFCVGLLSLTISFYIALYIKANGYFVNSFNYHSANVFKNHKEKENTIKHSDSTKRDINKYLSYSSLSKVNLKFSTIRYICLY
jgi:hypothetical protein